MEFHMRPMFFTCSCGVSRGHVKIALSSLGELICSWKCLKCERDMMVRLPFESLIADIPSHPGGRKMLASPVFTAEDTKLMSEMNISVENYE